MRPAGTGHKRPADLALCPPLTGVLDVATRRTPWRDTLTVRMLKGRSHLRGFTVRRSGARLQRARADRLGGDAGGALRRQIA